MEECPGSVVKAQLDTEKNTFMLEALSVVVLGASGDLAKKKTYPSLFDLYLNELLPRHVTVCGFARSEKTDEAFREGIRPQLVKNHPDQTDLVDHFLTRCYYRKGAYGSQESFTELAAQLAEWEAEQASGLEVGVHANRLYYFAIPPNVFLESGAAIKAAGMATNGWTRLIVEKPFGHDLESAAKLVDDMNAIFSEEFIYRIDHYLGKEIVQNLIMLRFGNIFLEPVMNRDYISSVTITFKEDFGTQGRGGYFDNYGIIRDIMQNHLMQVLTLIAMEAPVSVSGTGKSGQHIRNEKVKLLQSMAPVQPEDVVIGQYMADDQGNEGYLDDPTVPEGSVTPTYAVAILNIKNKRWDGVPFIMKAGKALDQRKAEIRIQFKEAPGLSLMFPGQAFSRNELVMRIQPDESVYLKCNMKAPGLHVNPMTSELDLSYHSRYASSYNPDAYTRLILDTLRGKQATFVRSDELLESWRIWTPVLEALESEHRKPIPYAYGSRGPAEGDRLVEKAGYVHDPNYTWEPHGAASM